MEFIGLGDTTYVYILKRVSKIHGKKVSYYTGITNNVSRRSKEHATGTTKSNRPYNIIGIKIVAITDNRSIAMAVERAVKQYSHKRKSEVYSGGKKINPTRQD